MKNIIQIAGVIDIEEAVMLMEENVDWLGFPLRLPVNKEDLTENEAKEVIKSIRYPHSSVLITYLSNHKEIIDFCDYLGVKIVQLHGDVEIGELVKLKKERNNIEIIKSLVVHEDNYKKLLTTVDDLSEHVDYFITDTFDPKTGASGATGKIHDWNISKDLVKKSSKPVILAGGINADNVYDAIMATSPAGVDVHTGVELLDGRKSREKVKKFVSEAKRGFSDLKIK